MWYTFVVYRWYESTKSEGLAVMNIQHFYSQIVNGVSDAFITTITIIFGPTSTKPQA